MKKVIDFKFSALVKSIQNYANHNHNGNFNAAVRDLVQKALKAHGEKE